MPPPKRADAARNREKILAVARAAFAEPGVETSMAEIARRAGVGMATLYRNFPGRRELLETLYTDEVDAICAAAETLTFTAWVHRFLAFSAGKHEIANELLALDRANPMFNANRERVLAAGRPLLADAQRRGELRDDLTLEQVLDMVMAIARIEGDPAYVEPILETALAGLRTAV
jgi:AcrR family transcriptional regulator